MKNQGVWITRIVMLAVALFVLVYMGYHIYNAFYSSIDTTTAVLFETTLSHQMYGVMVRDERPLDLPDGYLQLVVNDGERVAVGQTLAVTYNNSSAKDDYIQLEKLKEQLELLESISKKGSVASDLEKYDREISSRLISIMDAAGNGARTALDSDIEMLKSAMFQRAYLFEKDIDIEDVIEELTRQIDDLTRKLQNGSGFIKSDSSGIFTSAADGYEAIWTKAILDNISPEEFQRRFEMNVRLPLGNTGKMVYGIKWYFAGIIPADISGQMVVGSSLDVLLTVDNSAITVSMRVEKFSTESGGENVVILSCDKYMSKFLDRRKIQAELIFSSYEGLRIPKNSVRIDPEKGHYVYCIVMNQVKRKYVSIINDVQRENYYLVQYTPGSQNSLLPGDEIVTSGKKLFDGRVINR